MKYLFHDRQKRTVITTIPARRDNEGMKAGPKTDMAGLSYKSGDSAILID